MRTQPVSRRKFIRQACAGAAAFTIVPRHVLGRGYTPPSEVVTRAVIGLGRGRGFVSSNSGGGPPTTLAVCDVDKNRLAAAQAKAGEPCKAYTDFRRVLEHKDIDAVYIVTPPHWHALICIAAAQAGKDIFCEKPMTRFIAEGRAVVNAVQRYKRVFEIGASGRFGYSGQSTDIRTRKLMKSGLLEKVDAVYRAKQNWKVRTWSGMVRYAPQPVPDQLDWDMYQGPAPLKPYHRHRTHGSFRGYWDYDGGGLADMGQHYLNKFQWRYGKDETSPVHVEAYAPPAHPDACGMWGWVELTYADGLKLVLESREWGTPYDRADSHGLDLDKIAPELLAKVDAMPDPERMRNFDDAIRTRNFDGRDPESAHRCCTLLHLANIAIRTGRTIRYDPVTEQIIGDEEANRLINVPMRAPWHLT
ncbi:MAG: Gfo/Idh/MocA family oxidoreductase [Kiritimatiellae bacterium]|nr:Gfo/Idh/MocA family oxidoreductase [Kiritimatiellia bacterium]